MVPTESPGGTRITVGDHDWPAICRVAVADSERAMRRFDLAGSIGSAIGLIRRVDGFINLTEPYKIAKDNTRGDELGAILYQCLEVIRIGSLLLWAVMPQRINQLWEAMGLSIDPTTDRLTTLSAWGGLDAGRRVERIALFPRIDA